jgi:hypothetical protein
MTKETETWRDIVIITPEGISYDRWRSFLEFLYSLTPGMADDVKCQQWAYVTAMDLLPSLRRKATNLPARNCEEVS